MEPEKRTFKMTEFRSIPSEDGSITLEGYASVFNSPSENMGWGDWEMREYIAPGAFTESLKKSDCRALVNHENYPVLGRESAKTLLLTQDETGLKSTIKLPDTQFARDLAVSVDRGDINEMSFCFIVAKDTWETDSVNKIDKRTINEVKELLDVSVVTFPAYPDTSVAKRSLERFKCDDNAVAEEEDRSELRYKILLMEENK